MERVNISKEINSIIDKMGVSKSKEKQFSVIEDILHEIINIPLEYRPPNTSISKEENTKIITKINKEKMLESAILNTNVPFAVNYWKNYTLTEFRYIKDIIYDMKKKYGRISINEDYINGIELKIQTDMFYFGRDVISESILNSVQDLLIGPVGNRNRPIRIRWEIKPKYRTPSGCPVYDEFHIEVNYDKHEIVDIKYPYDMDWMAVNRSRFPEYESDIIFFKAIGQKNLYDFEVLLKECEAFLSDALLCINTTGTVVYRFIKADTTWILLDYATDLMDAERKFLNATRKGD